jgi:death-on-curing protein
VSEPIWLLDAAVLIAHEVSLANFGGADGIRDPGLLESALAKPRNLFVYGEPGMPELAAAYTAGIVQNHPFVDGNKRTGFLAGATFLELNGLRLIATEPEATRIMLGLAAGDVSELQLAAWFREKSEKIT